MSPSDGTIKEFKSECKKSGPQVIEKSPNLVEEPTHRSNVKSESKIQQTHIPTSKNLHKRLPLSNIDENLNHVK